jgi:hypothetical protein
MQRGFGIAPHPVEDLFVRLHAGARRDLAAVNRPAPAGSGCAARRESPRPTRADPGRSKVVEPQCRWLPWIGRADRDRAARVGIHRSDVHLVTGPAAGDVPS